MVRLRGRGKTVCARVACLALLGGPSTSPLEVRVKIRVLISLVVMTSMSAFAQPKSIPGEVESWIQGYAASQKSRAGVVPYYYPDGTRMAEGILVGEPATAVVFTLEGYERGSKYRRYLAVFWKRRGHYAYCCSQLVGGSGVRMVEEVAILSETVRLSGKLDVDAPNSTYTAEFIIVNSQLVQSPRTSNNRWRGP